MNAIPQAPGLDSDATRSAERAELVDMSIAGHPGLDLSVIIVNWNAVDYLIEAIASIYDNTRNITLEIIVVDNASPKKDVDRVKERFPATTIIKSKENIGFARANNLGFQYAKGRNVLLLNPDTKLVGPAINRMLDQIGQLPNAGIVGARHVNPDLTVQTTSVQTFPRILNQMLNIEWIRVRWPNCPLWKLGPLFTEPIAPVPVEVIPGACMLLKRNVFERVGMFSSNYFMYGEDIDLNRKIAMAGLTNYYIPDAMIIHYGGRSSTQQNVNQWATLMQCRAMNQYYTRNHGALYAALYRFAMGTCAAGRLLCLGIAFPLARLTDSKQVLRNAMAKWRTILRWTVGLGGDIR